MASIPLLSPTCEVGRSSAILQCPPYYYVFPKARWIAELERPEQSQVPRVLCAVDLVANVYLLFNSDLSVIACAVGAIAVIEIHFLLGLVARIYSCTSCLIVFIFPFSFRFRFLKTALR
jgi:hypothetical protein